MDSMGSIAIMEACTKHGRFKTTFFLVLTSIKRSVKDFTNYEVQQLS
jgi:hypothetical protein